MSAEGSELDAYWEAVDKLLKYVEGDTSFKYMGYEIHLGCMHLSFRAMPSGTSIPNVRIAGKIGVV